MIMPISMANLNSYIQTCNAARESVSSEGQFRGSYWAACRMGHGPIGSILLTPNSKNADCQNTNSNGMMTLRSRHPGEVNCLFTDGNDKFVKDSINRITWWAVGTKASGEVISANSY